MDTDDKSKRKELLLTSEEFIIEMQKRIEKYPDRQNEDKNNERPD